MIDVFMNEKFIGTVDNPEEFINKVRTSRRQGKISSVLNIFYNERAKDIVIETSKGRSRRPLIVIEY